MWKRITAAGPIKGSSCGRRAQMAHTSQPALKLLTAHTRVDSFNVSEHDQDLSDIRYRFRYGFRGSDASSDAGIAQGAGGAGAAVRPLRQPFPDGGARKGTRAKGGRGSKRRPRWGRRIVNFCDVLVMITEV